MISKLDISLFYHTIPLLIHTERNACVNVFPTCYPWKVNRGKDGQCTPSWKVSSKLLPKNLCSELLASFLVLFSE